MDSLLLLLGGVVLASILGPVAGRYGSHRSQVGPTILTALVVPALLLLAAAYAYWFGATGEPEKVALFGVVLATISLLIGLVTSALVILVTPRAIDGDFRPQRDAQGERFRILFWCWIAVVAALAVALFSVLW